MQQLLILAPAPLHLTDGGIEPLVPTRLALLGRFAVEEGGDACPLLFAVFHYGGFEDFIFGVFPDASFDEDAYHGCLVVDMDGSALSNGGGCGVAGCWCVVTVHVSV